MPRACALAALLALGLLSAPAAAAAQAVVPGYTRPDSRPSLRVFRSESFKEVNAALTEWRVAWKNRDLAGTLGRYTDDATLLLPNGALLQGRDEIERVLTGLVPRAGAFDMAAADFAVCETMAFLVGRFFYEGSAGSGSVSGTHVTIFRLERDRWVIRSQVFRPEPQAPTATTGAAGEAAAPPAADSLAPDATGASGEAPCDEA